MAQGIAPSVWPASGVPNIVWDLPNKIKEREIVLNIAKKCLLITGNVNARLRHKE